MHGLLRRCRGFDHERARQRSSRSARPHPARTRAPKRPKSFLDEVMRAAKKAGHTRVRLWRAGAVYGRSTFGRGRGSVGRCRCSARPAARRREGARGAPPRHAPSVSAPLSAHLAYLKRDGVTRDGANARMFDAAVRRRRRRGPSPSAARTTGIISGSSSRPRMPAR